MTTKDSTRPAARRARTAPKLPPVTAEQKRRVDELGMTLYECTDGVVLVLGGEYKLDCLYIRRDKSDDPLEDWIANREREATASAAYEKLKQRVEAIEDFLCFKSPEAENFGIYIASADDGEIVLIDQWDGDATEVRDWLADHERAS